MAVSFDTVLIANRGEIACRVVRTCRRLGIRTVAVYSDADRGAVHVAMADEAVRLGPAPARESYLDIDAVIEAARRTGAQAIHPGYGFLSENADFAEACADAGVVFIGPPAAAIRAMGSKSAAKTIMEKAGVPLVPGYHGDDQDADLLAAEAERIGYPVLIKAVSGGGGKGMRRVDAAGAFAEALAGARREAAGAFADDRVLVEKFVEHPRHIEMQVFADDHGHAVHLFERDCSVQRRHQKILEEAPAPGMTEERRARMGEAAVEAARAIGYRGAGTVEFIAAPGGEFYFMEMNTRLQVEHPVTEMVTGQDLVEWQLRVAGGEPLPCTQAELHLHGHAFEARVYAEDPAREFLPATGTIVHLREPDLAHTRIDSGVREGDTVGLHYDPMIAKLVAWGEDRPAALKRLRQLLAGYELVGPVTNMAFLARVAGTADFAAGRITTDFVEQHREALFPAAAVAPERVVAAAAVHELLRLRESAVEGARASADPGSPWHAVDGWQPNAKAGLVLEFLDGELPVTVTARSRGEDYGLAFGGREVFARGALGGRRTLHMELDGIRFTATVVAREARRTVIIDGDAWTLVRHDPLAAGLDDTRTEGSLTAPMPGAIIDVRVAPGDAVQRDQPLVVLEAMKMEYTVSAPADGVVECVNVAVGDQVDDGAELLVIVPG